MYVKEGKLIITEHKKVWTESLSHGKRVARLAFRLSREFGLSYSMSKDIFISAMYHDIGKCLIPADIINKTSQLTTLEYERIKMHPIYSYSVLKKKGFSIDICNFAKYHHENYCGDGYPNGLKAELIPLGARILRLCDVYDALVSERSYKRAMSKEDAIKILYKECDKYDLTLFNYFLKLIQNGSK